MPGEMRHTLQNLNMKLELIFLKDSFTKIFLTKQTFYIKKTSNFNFFLISVAELNYSDALPVPGVK
jgi:hypothetical protein